MSQPGRANPLDESVGYTLKSVDAALRSAMDAVLRPLGLTVPQYACMELLAQRPGLSNADLARGAFVTRQSMNVVLRGLQDRGLVERPDATDHGRARPAALTPAGKDLLGRAGRGVVAVEDRMLQPLSAPARQELLSSLRMLANALGSPTTDESAMPAVRPARRGDGHDPRDA